MQDFQADLDTQNRASQREYLKLQEHAIKERELMEQEHTRIKAELDHQIKEQMKQITQLNKEHKEMKKAEEQSKSMLAKMEQQLKD